MLETLIKRGRGRPPKDGVSRDFKTLTGNLLGPSALSGIQYPKHLEGDPAALPSRFQLERRSFAINRVFEKCVKNFELVAGRPGSISELKYLVNAVADFIEKI